MRDLFEETRAEYQRGERQFRLSELAERLRIAEKAETMLSKARPKHTQQLLVQAQISYQTLKAMLADTATSKHLTITHKQELIGRMEKLGQRLKG